MSGVEIMIEIDMDLIEGEKEIMTMIDGVVDGMMRTVAIEEDLVEAHHLLPVAEDTMTVRMDDEGKAKRVSFKQNFRPQSDL